MNNHEVKRTIGIRSRNHEYIQSRETTGKGWQVIGICFLILCLVIYAVGEYQLRQGYDCGNVVVEIGGER